jgi:hypothetical protein
MIMPLESPAEVGWRLSAYYRPDLAILGAHSTWKPRHIVTTRHCIGSSTDGVLRAGCKRRDAAMVHYCINEQQERLPVAILQSELCSGKFSEQSCRSVRSPPQPVPATIARAACWDVAQCSAGDAQRTASQLIMLLVLPTNNRGWSAQVTPPLTCRMG